MSGQDLVGEVGRNRKQVERERRKTEESAMVVTQRTPPMPPSGALVHLTALKLALGLRLGMGCGLLVCLGLGADLIAPPALQAQQPVRPLVRNGSCPMGYHGLGEYCVPSSSSGTRGALEKSGNGCPMGFYSSGNYCLSSPGSDREAIPKLGSSCPLGWYSSGRYCLHNR